MVDRILVADDQVDVLESLRLLLKNEGFAIETVTSPCAVLDAVQAEKYDVLLLGMNYASDTTSGREGLELLSQVHRISDALPVVLMTAWGSVDLAVEAMRTGGCDFIEKPWNNNRLLDMLRRNIQQGRSKLRDLFSLASAKKARWWLSGDQKNELSTTLSVQANGFAVTEPMGRTHTMLCLLAGAV